MTGQDFQRIGSGNRGQETVHEQSPDFRKPFHLGDLPNPEPDRTAGCHISPSPASSISKTAPNKLLSGLQS